MNNNELTHHGVKGMKKGHRRYQNKDGTLTPLGRIHYGIGIGEGADERYDKKVQTKTTASEGKPSDSFIKSKSNSSTNSLSRDEKKVQKALEKAMKKSIKEQKEQEEPKKEEPKKEEPKKEEPKKEEPKKEEIKEEVKDDYESRKSDYDKRKNDFDLEKAERQLKDDQTAEANKEHNDKMDRQSKDLKTGAELAKQASIGTTYASKATKEIGKVDNTKRMREELKSMSNEQIKEINDRLTLENRYKELNKDRMTKGFEAVHNFFNIATPVIGLLGSSLAVAAQIKELKKK